MAEPNQDLSFIMEAIVFAAQKHRFQKRKDEKTPYVNHPLGVADILVRTALVTDPEILAAALLHDTIEDTDTTRDELRTVFGERVLALVLECTDDKSLPKEERKRLQVEHAADKSADAKLIKIADKINNMLDIADHPPTNWSLQRKIDYIKWAKDVFAGLKGGNRALDELFETTAALALNAFGS